MSPGDLLLRLDGITKRFGGLPANDAISLELHAGEILALLGENGAGKTTLMSVLFGHHVADAGRMWVAGPEDLRPLPPGSPAAALAAGIGMVHQHFSLAENLTVLDNVMLGTEPMWRPWRRRGAARARLAELIEGSGLTVPLDAAVGGLAIGERQRVEILKALYRGARVLVLDEPTAVLTPPEAEQLFIALERLAAGGMGLIFISHKLGEVIRLCHRVVVLRRGRKVAETTVAGSSRSALAEAMVGRALTPRRREAMAAGATLLRLRDVRVGTALEVEALDVRAHEIVGIAGVAGNGQQALSRLVAGLARPTAGEMTFRGDAWPGPRARRVVDAGVGRVPEDRNREGLVADLPIAENLALESYRERRFQRCGVIRRNAVRRHAQALIEAYDVRCEGAAQPAGQLSGGNAQKLVLARALAGAPAMLLTDQPTRGLDVGAVGDIHARLLHARRRGAGILLISEDLDELTGLADRIAVIYRGRLGEALPAASLSIGELGLMMAGQHRRAA